MATPPPRSAAAAAASAGPAAVPEQQLLQLLLSTPPGDRARSWTPTLLPLLTRWAAALGASSPSAAHAAGSIQRRPARPWERHRLQPAQQAQHGSRDPAQQQQLQMLQQAVDTVCDALHQAAADHRPQGLSTLLAPSLFFLAAACPVLEKQQQSKTTTTTAAAAAAACAALSALAAASPVQPWLAAPDAAEGLSRLFGSCQALTLACQADACASSWLLSSLLSSLHTAVPQLLHELLVGSQAGQHQQQQQHEQATQWAASSCVAPLTGLFKLGQQLGLAQGRSALAATTASAAAATQHGSLATLQSLTQLLVVTCRECGSGDVLLLGLAAAAAAGLCMGASGAVPAAPTRGSSDLDAAWAGAAGWADAPTGLHQQIPHSQQPAASALQQQILQQVQALRAAVASACARCCAQSHEGPADAAAAGAVAVGRLLLGYAFSRLMAHQPQLLHHHQQQQLQDASWGPGMLLSLDYATQQCASLAGVFYHAGACQDAAAANQWLHAHQAQHPATELATLVRWLAGAVGGKASTPAPQLQQLLAALRASADSLLHSYSVYQATTPAAVAGQLDAAAVRQQLDTSFALHVALLSEVWAAANSVRLQLQPAPLHGSAAAAGGEGGAVDTRAAVVVDSLAVLASLQFCRVQLPAYVELLLGLVTALATSSAACEGLLGSGLPAYDQLVAPWPPQTTAPDSHSAVSARWHDHVVAAQLSFLLPLIPVAVRGARDQALAATRAMPLLLLVLPHPAPALAQAAHAAFASLVAIAAEQQQQEHGEASAPPLMRVVRQALPMYISRSLGCLPGHGSLEGLSTCFYSLLKNLPTGSPEMLLAVGAVADRAVQLAVQEAAATGSSSAAAAAAAATDQQQQRQPSVPVAAAPSSSKAASDRLAELLVLAVQLVDMQLLPSVVSKVEDALLAAPQAAQQRWLLLLYHGCLAVSDYTRKPGLMVWFDGMAKQQQQLATWARRPPSKGSSSRQPDGGVIAQPPGTTDEL